MSSHLATGVDNEGLDNMLQQFPLSPSYIALFFRLVRRVSHRRDDDRYQLTIFFMGVLDLWKPDMATALHSCEAPSVDLTEICHLNVVARLTCGGHLAARNGTARRPNLC